MNAKTLVLGRVRHALVDLGQEVQHPPPRFHEETPDRDLVELFRERACSYRSTVVSVTEAGIGDAVADACRRHDVHSVAAASDVPPDWIEHPLGRVNASGLESAALDGIGACVTGCAIAIASSGTVVLDHGPRQGPRRLSLLPDLLICVIDATQIVARLGAAMGSLHAAVAARRPITLISGPSATSDIELKRVEGVHGPRNLTLIVVQ